MLNTLYGTKIGMTSSYDTRGRRVGATILEVLPNVVAQVKSVEKDGYTAVQLGVGSRKVVKKPVAGHLKKNKIEAKIKFLREIRVEEADVESGREINVREVFGRGDAVKVSGVTKGRGFQGGVKRYNFQGGPKTHGQSDRHRAPGSIGAGTTPGRVYKGKRMAGHMGMIQATYTNLEVLEVDLAKNVMVVKGGVPGPIGGLVKIVNIGKIKGYTPPPEEKEEEEVEAKAADGVGIPVVDQEPTEQSTELPAEEGEVEGSEVIVEEAK